MKSLPIARYGAGDNNTTVLAGAPPPPNICLNRPTPWCVPVLAEPLLAAEILDTGENILAHADAVAQILKKIGGSEAMQAASYLVYACDHLNKPQEVIAKAFGDNFAALAMETTKLVRVQRHARQARLHGR